MIVFYRAKDVGGGVCEVTISCGVESAKEVSVRIKADPVRVGDPSYIADLLMSLVPDDWPDLDNPPDMPGWMSFDRENELRKREEKFMVGRRFFSTSNSLSDTLIPDTWDNVADFADWWINNGQPICPPKTPKVYCSDDAASVCLFRHGQFQVELYLIYPNPNLPVHEHPGVEVIEMRLNEYSIIDGRAVVVQQYRSANPLQDGEAHGDGINFKQTGGMDTGFPLLAIQRWDEGLTPSTVASRWKGKPVGPKQAGLVRSHYPRALVTEGFVDVTYQVDTVL